MAKNVMTYEGLKELEKELENLKVNRRREIAEKIKEAREQGDLSENAEYDAAKDEQRDIEARIEELEKILGQESTPIFVCENEAGGILGHLFCSIKEPVSPILNPIKTLFIEDLCVNEKARGQKVGEQLYRFAEDYARKIGCYNLTLNVWNDNVGALRFYERLGLQAQETVMEKIL